MQKLVEGHIYLRRTVPPPDFLLSLVFDLWAFSFSVQKPSRPPDPEHWIIADMTRVETNGIHSVDPSPSPEPGIYAPLITVFTDDRKQDLDLEALAAHTLR